MQLKSNDNLFFVATSFGHIDFLDDGALSSFVEIFHFCKMSDNHDSEKLYRKFVAGQSVALFKGLMGECSSFEYLSTPPWLLMNVKTLRQGESKCPIGSCKMLSDQD